jgi:uncharacterized membrane protein
MLCLRCCWRKTPRGAFGQCGALSGSLAKYGIDNDFLKKLGETIPVNSSALFVLVKSVTEDNVLAEIEPYKPRVLKRRSLAKMRPS